MNEEAINGSGKNLGDEKPTGEEAVKEPEHKEPEEKVCNVDVLFTPISLTITFCYYFLVF